MRLLLTFLLLLASNSLSARLEFTIHKLDSGVEGPTILVVGGIQGDEPGGFHAASLLVTDYKIKKGTVWVVPNLNFESIINRSRGINGDMNRKFAQMQKGDPDYQAVERVKSLIRDPKVDFVFNLHDGSGFYREQKEDSLHSPNRWGQCIIIDQERVDSPKYKEIGRYSRDIVAEVNKKLLTKEHRFHLKNTHTKDGDVEMSKTLTFYAINQGKPAVGLEASKSLNKGERVYYHLTALESYMTKLGVEFERTFKLTPPSIQAAITSNLQLALFDEKLNYVIDNARRTINYVPLEQDAEIEYRSNNPLVAVTKNNNRIKVRYGNNSITSLRPDYFPYESSISSINMTIDGKDHQVKLGNIVHVDKEFIVNAEEGYRINVIGWKDPNIRNESGVVINKEKIRQRFSLDRAGNLYRVEIYRDKYFSGMVLVHFGSVPSREVKYVSPAVPVDEEPTDKANFKQAEQLSLINQTSTGR